MLLAAGRGERMRPLTDNCPKPMLSVQGKPLMQWHLEALLRGGCQRVVVNTAWLEQVIVQKFNDHFGFEPLYAKDSKLLNAEYLTLHYSMEGREFGGALETAGGICRALPLLFPNDLMDAGEVFWVLAADVFTPGFAFTQQAVQRFTASGKLAHIWLVPNPAHNPRGDFGLDASTGLAQNLPKDDPQPRYTYSTIGLYHRALFAPPWCDIPAGNPIGVKAALAPLLRAAMGQGLVAAELYAGPWTDVGTPERLAQLNGQMPLA
ncbi:nucleotidyltransferase family protein [Rhodoferax sp.]|uniref:nucleotidyltransferase family protein n=1 Tax=Rhodoferax sp. TaxID=50421 RepID=UPI002841AEDE|nr:nucleotidyltransferase family protein [Rhodoferax sp.]MDR3369255.1 nucleotidyltransferase family protein [Rhodoferax sp.]